MDDSIDTLPGLETGEGAREHRAALVTSLTVVHHPTLRRVGDRVRVRAGDTLGLSRERPLFSAPRGGRPASGLDDAHVSRVPASIEARRDGALRLVLSAEHHATLDGAAVVGEVFVARARLLEGVVLELSRRVAILLHLADASEPMESSLGLVGASPLLEEVRRSILSAAPTTSPVLVVGESGVGKELVAQALHRESGRAGPLVAVNVGRLAPSTAASELFGHRRGAFTGASEAHEGLIARADGGTLFLDEIGEAHPDVQALLLRALETREVLPLGAARPRAVDFRLVSATDADLRARVADGSLRRALYHRVAGFTIAVPTLRERREDIPRLAVHTLEEALTELGRSELLVAAAGTKPWLHRGVMARLLRHDWPGNVRELRNAVRQLAIAHADSPSVREQALEPLLFATPTAPVEPSAPASAGPPTGPSSAPSHDHVLRVLREHGWAFGPTARALGMNRTTFYRLVEGRPDIRKGSDLSRDELSEAKRLADGDLEAMSAALRVSARAIGRRMSELGIPRE